MFLSGDIACFETENSDTNTHPNRASIISRNKLYNDDCTLLSKTTVEESSYQNIHLLTNFPPKILQFRHIITVTLQTISRHLGRRAYAPPKTRLHISLILHVIKRFQTLATVIIGIMFKNI